MTVWKQLQASALSHIYEIIVLICWQGYRIQTKQSYGLELALLASVILAGSSIPRALRSQKPLPT
jgi:uncharacterized membrane protein (UPF0136 family)